MKKILLVTDTWHPQINGVVTVLEKIKALLEERGYTVKIIEPGQFRTVPLPLYPEIRLALFPGRRVNSLIESFAPDYIYIATEGPLGYATRRVCIKKRLHFTTSYQTHFHLYAEMRFKILARMVLPLLRRFHSAATHTFVTTSALKEELEKYKFKNIVVWPLGVDTEFFSRTPHPVLPALPGPVFLYFGRLAKEKSPEEFLRLSLPGTKLIIGDGPDRRNLESVFSENTKFVGYKKGKELIEWLSLSDVLVFPSQTETFGLVMIESLACGIPVAAHPVMGPKEIITPGEDGFLDDDLEKAARKCLTLNRDNCRKKALQYSWENSVSTFLDNLSPV